MDFRYFWPPLWSFERTVLRVVDHSLSLWSLFSSNDSIWKEFPVCFWYSADKPLLMTSPCFSYPSFKLWEISFNFAFSYKEFQFLFHLGDQMHWTCQRALKNFYRKQECKCIVLPISELVVQQLVEMIYIQMLAIIDRTTYTVLSCIWCIVPIPLSLLSCLALRLDFIVERYFITVLKRFGIKECAINKDI